MHYALDESLAALPLGAATENCSDSGYQIAIQGPGLAALVLKPPLLGGFARCISLHRRAPPGTEVTISVRVCVFGGGLLRKVQQATYDVL